MHVKKYLTITLTIFALILLILEPKIAASGVADGIDVCLRVVIPSLFPFFIVSTYLNTIISGYHLPGIRYINNLLHIPEGGESILVLGLTGGYPVGAKLLADMYQSKQLDKETAQILMGYCNNAGPAFIFGIAGTAFSYPHIAVILWCIHILSAIVTGILLPKPKSTEMKIPKSKKISFANAIKNSINVSTSVCGWIITFKILFAYLNAWFPELFQTIPGMIITGILDLSNGCLAVQQVASPHTRFLLYAVFFAFGGICVFLQTTSVAGSLGTGYYLHGKIMQTCISFLFAVVAGPFLFSDFLHFSPQLFISIVLSVLILGFFRWHAKKLWKSDCKSCIMQLVH